MISMAFPCCLACRDSEQETLIIQKYATQISEQWTCRHCCHTPELGGRSWELCTSSWGHELVRREEGHQLHLPSHLGPAWSPLQLQSPSFSSADRGAAALHGLQRKDNKTVLTVFWHLQCACHALRPFLIHVWINAIDNS